MTDQSNDPQHPHGNQPVKTSGADPDRAPAAMVLLHGRGATADGILSLGTRLDRPGLALFAPQAADQTWYPRSFLADRTVNQPHLDSALRRIDKLVDEISDHGIDADRLILAGFSQGACLAVEFAARHPRRYGGVVAFTGGLIGPEISADDYPGSLASTPVFLGSSDPDPHVPVQRVEQTESILEQMEADVTTRLYPQMGHTINNEELSFARRIVDQVLEQQSS